MVSELSNENAWLSCLTFLRAGQIETLWSSRKTGKKKRRIRWQRNSARFIHHFLSKKTQGWTNKWSLSEDSHTVKIKIICLQLSYIQGIAFVRQTKSVAWKKWMGMFWYAIFAVYTVNSICTFYGCLKYLDDCEILCPTIRIYNIREYQVCYFQSWESHGNLWNVKRSQRSYGNSKFLWSVGFF